MATYILYDWNGETLRVQARNILNATLYADSVGFVVADYEVEDE